MEPYLKEVHEYLCLLRRHGFLRYTSDAREYRVKRMVVIDGIAEALGRKASVHLPVYYDEIPVESLEEASTPSVLRFMKQTVRNMKRSIGNLGSGSSIAKGYHQAIHRWEKAAQACEALGQRSTLRVGSRPSRP